MFFRCCCCYCILDVFIMRPKRKIRTRVKKVDFDIVETQSYIIKLPKRP
jgi:hypothetical protein